MGYEKVRNNVLSQESETKTCGSKIEKNNMIGRSGTCEGKQDEERKRNDDAI